jgi:hypothetical protein
VNLVVRADSNRADARGHLEQLSTKHRIDSNAPAPQSLAAAKHGALTARHLKELLIVAQREVLAADALGRLSKPLMRQYAGEVQLAQLARLHLLRKQPHHSLALLVSAAPSAARQRLFVLDVQTHAVELARGGSHAARSPATARAPVDRHAVAGHKSRRKH